jgi:hypothetical protein
LSVSAEIRGNEETKQHYLFNNEERRFSEGEKVVEKTNVNTPSRDGFPEGK